jgi:hypothetical protein
MRRARARRRRTATARDGSRGRFCDQLLELALEATAGSAFAREELRAIGARVHLAEPAKTAARCPKHEAREALTPVARTPAICASG